MDKKSSLKEYIDTIPLRILFTGFLILILFLENEALANRNTDSLANSYANEADKAKLSGDFNKYTQNLWSLATLYHHQRDSLQVFQTLLRLQTTLLSISALHQENKKNIDSLIIQNYLVLAKKNFAFGNYTNAYHYLLRGKEYQSDRNINTFLQDFLWQECMIYHILGDEQSLLKKIEKIHLDPEKQKHRDIALQIFLLTRDAYAAHSLPDMDRVFNKYQLNHADVKQLIKQNSNDFSTDFENKILLHAQNENLAVFLRFHLLHHLTIHALLTKDYKNFKQYHSDLEALAVNPYNHYSNLLCSEALSVYYTREENYIALYPIQQELMNEKNKILSQSIEIKEMEFHKKYEELISGITSLDAKISSFRRVLILSVIAILIVITATILIVRTNRKLQSINNTKEKLFTIISHDLRSPLVSITSIVNESITTEKDKTKIQREVNRIMLLLDNLLYWSARQTGEIKANPTIIDVHEILEHSLGLVAHMATVKNIQIHYAGDNDAFAFADEDMVSIAIRNILTNAVKYTPRNGEVYVDILESESMCEVRIKDTGPGFKPARKKKLSTGLGLPISRNLLKLNNAKLQIKSITSKGTVVTILLPPPKKISA